jgi:hypothetical protein
LSERRKPRGSRALTGVHLAILLAAALFSASPAGGAETHFGMNRVNLAWMPPPARQKILDAMADHGIDLVRLSLTPPFEASIDALRIANQNGMRILLEIPLSNKDFYPSDAVKRSGQGRIWDIYRLSEIDPNAFRQVFRDALRRIESLGITLLAVQLGNELNLAGYNGDLHVYARDNLRTARSRAELTNRSAFERGIEKYVAILQIVREEIEDSSVNRQAKIVSAGISDMGVADADRRGMERLDAKEFMTIVQAAGIENHIDAYGVHVYPSHKGSKEARGAHVRSILSFCDASSKGKPCWITEWGIANPSERCPLNDKNREEVIREVRSRFEPLIRNGRLSMVFYFDWDSDTPYSVWRCNTLTPAGKAAVVPAYGLPGTTSD